MERVEAEAGKGEEQGGEGMGEGERDGDSDGEPREGASGAPALIRLRETVGCATRDRLRHFVNFTNGIEAFGAIVNQCG